LNNQQVVEIIQKLQVDVDERNKVIDQLREEYRLLQSKYELLAQRERRGQSPMQQPENEPDKEVIYM
jgi:FtsZ-binding cell division protein ZapB